MAVEKAAFRRRRPFELSFQGVGAFPDWSIPRVLWAGRCDGQRRLIDLAHGVEAATVQAGFAPWDRPFRPHLTLGRRLKEIGTKIDGAEAERALAMHRAGPERIERVEVYRSRLTPQGPDLHRLPRCRGMLGSCERSGRNPMSISEKEKALELALMQIEKQHGKGSIMRLGEASAKLNVEVIPTGALALDIALGVGGIPRGRVVEIYGPESSGKTTLALHVIAEAQRRGGIAAVIDVEHALGSQLRWETGRRCGQPADLPARQRRKRSGDRRSAGSAAAPWT